MEDIFDFDPPFVGPLENGYAESLATIKGRFRDVQLTKRLLAELERLYPRFASQKVSAAPRRKGRPLQRGCEIYMDRVNYSERRNAPNYLQTRRARADRNNLFLARSNAAADRLRYSSVASPSTTQLATAKPRWIA